MSWLLAGGLILLVAVLAHAFIRNAVALKRDLDTRFEDLRIRLEREANSVVDELFVEAGPGASGRGVSE